MVLAVGCVHPEGENDEYDGLYFKQSELNELSQQLVDVPVCIEHLDGQSVGRIIHSWVGTSKPECFVIFETDDNNLPGHIAGELIQQGYCNDLSLGHECKIDSNSLSVVSKKPVEVSICTEGARERTHIYGFNSNEKKEYISVRSLASKNTKKQTNFFIHLNKKKKTSNTDKNISNIVTMTDSNSAPIAVHTDPISTEVAESNSSPDTSATDTKMMGEILCELKMLREKNRLLESQNEEHQKIGKRKREAAVDGRIREMVAKLYAEYDSLDLHKDELEAQLEAMKNSPQANGIVEMLSCAAAAQHSSVVQLEKALQERKKLLEENKRLKTQVSMFADPSERVVSNNNLDTVNAVASRLTDKSENTNKFDALFGTPIAQNSKTCGKSRGMQELFPNVFDSMIASAGPSSTGMQKFGQNDINFFNNKMSKSRVHGSGFETHSFKN
jgi:hypothetical protein